MEPGDLTVDKLRYSAFIRDAMMLGYNVVFVSDATAALSDAAHLSARCSVFTAFGDVMTTRETIASLIGRTTSLASDKNRS